MGPHTTPTRLVLVHRVTGPSRSGVMGIEDDGIKEAVLEAAEDDLDWEECPCCGDVAWLRVVAQYARGTCWVLFCGGCGKPVMEKWNILP